MVGGDAKHGGTQTQILLTRWYWGQLHPAVAILAV